MDTLFGLNVLEFVVLAWIGCTVLAVALDVGPEIYHEHASAWREKHPKKDDPELTVQLPVGSFDPDTTMKLPKIQKQRVEPLFIISKRPEVARRGRHAKA